MYIKFWGTRGSIPTPMTTETLRAKIRQALIGAAGLNLHDPDEVAQYLDRLPPNVGATVGGNTTCIEVQLGDQLLIIDAGSGLRLLGFDLMKRGFSQGNKKIDFLMSHTHWDHIQGFPFFAPAFIRGNQLTFHSPFPDMEARLDTQQSETFFPVDLNYMQASFTFRQLAKDAWNQIGQFKIHPLQLSHPGETYGYRIEGGGKCLVFASDSEYKRLQRENTEEFIQFFREADLLVFDAQYSFSEALDKPDWGHSSAVMGAELARRAGVKRLALFHHDPTSSDDKIFVALEEAEAYLRRTVGEKPEGDCDIFVACDGLSLEI